MLSPASLRVCCLAVMAPALTKADRRSDCLPVVISEPFCDLKTETPYSRKDIEVTKLSSKFASLLHNRRKAYVRKTWFRTQLKNSSPGCFFKTPCSDLQDGGINAVSEAWHGTSVTLAVADKVRLKYTMNKHISQKNMGLARTNASLSLNSMKKVNRITQFSPRDKSSPSTPDVGESSPDLPHSTNSFLEACIIEGVSSSSRDSEQNSGGDVSDRQPIACTDKYSIMPLSEGVSVPLISEDINLNMPVTLTDPECVVLDSVINTALSDPAGQSSKSCIVPPIDKSSESLDQSSRTNFNLLSSSSPKIESACLSCPHFQNLSFNLNDFDTSACCPAKTHLAQTTSSAVKPKISRKKVPKRKEYCPCPVECKALLDEEFNDNLNKILAAVEKSELLVRICISAYSKKEISELVKTYQNKLGIPCQRQLKRSNKDDMRALQNEEVKNMSTAALVNLVRKLECPNQSSLLPGVDLSFGPEDIADVMKTSTELLSSIKRELKCVDPDLTDSSDSESELEAHSVHKMALLEFMKKRAALTCRSTWLIARIHELENQLRTANSALQKLSSSLGEICFEEDHRTLSETSSQKAKGLTGPVNGYLDKVNIAHIGHSVETTNLDDDSLHEQCSRTKALNWPTFQKRHAVSTTGLHQKNSKLAKLPTLGCHCCCNDDVLPCVLCMGRYQSVQSIDPYTMPLLDRVSLLDSNFHPLLSFQKDVPLILHFESNLKKNESQYQVERPVSPSLSITNLDIGVKPKSFSVARSRSQKFNRYFSAKYRNKHLRNTKHLRKHGLVFGKWRRYQAKRSFQSRDQFRRISIDSSASSQDSPVPSPGSLFDESYDSVKRRRDENQFDIDDVIIPYSNKSARLVEFEFKDIIVPSFRIEGSDNNFMPIGILNTSSDIIQAEEDTHDETYLARHNPLEVDEKKINRRPSILNIQPNPKRLRRDHRLDSHADSSGANTPDPIIFSDQDMFQDQNSMTVPTPPALSPPPTPSSIIPFSDDSQPSLRLDRKRVPPQKRPSEDNVRSEVEDIEPYERRTFPLTDEQYEEITFDPYGEDFESGRSSPASAGSTTMSTSTIEDIADPEWRVLRNVESLKLKLHRG